MGTPLDAAASTAPVPTLTRDMLLGALQDLETLAQHLIDREDVPGLSAHLTIRDLFAHRSGLAGNAGNELDALGFVREDGIHRTGANGRMLPKPSSTNGSAWLPRARDTAISSAAPIWPRFASASRTNGQHWPNGTLMAYKNEYVGVVTVVESSGALVLKLGPNGERSFRLTHFDRDLFVYYPYDETPDLPVVAAFTIDSSRKAAGLTLEDLNDNGQGVLFRTAA